MIPWWYYSNGYNIKPTSSYPATLPKSITAIGYSSTFTASFNVAAMMLYAAFVIALIYYKLIRRCLPKNYIISRLSIKII